MLRTIRMYLSVPALAAAIVLSLGALNEVSARGGHGRAGGGHGGNGDRGDGHGEDRHGARDVGGHGQGGQYGEWSFGYRPGSHGWPGYDSGYSYYGSGESFNANPNDSTCGQAFPRDDSEFFPAGRNEYRTAVHSGSVRIRIRVPADAELWFEVSRTTQTGPVRDFESPPLTPGENFTYTIRAQWMENGHLVTRTRDIDVSAGRQLMVDLTSASATIQPGASTDTARRGSDH